MSSRTLSPENGVLAKWGGVHIRTSVDLAGDSNSSARRSAALNPPRASRRSAAGTRGSTRRSSRETAPPSATRNCSGGATRCQALRCCTLGIIGRTRRPAARSAATSDQRASATPLPCSTAVSVAAESSAIGTDLGPRRIATDPPQPVHPRFGPAVNERVAGEVVQRVDRAELREQGGAADGEHPFLEQPLGLEPVPVARAIEDRGVEVVTAEVERGSGWARSGPRSRDAGA